MLTGNPGHLRSFDYIGRYRYSLTFCTDRRQPHFTTAEPVDLVHGQIVRAARAESAAIVAACYMPDHVHLLIEMESELSDALALISRAKQYSGFHFKRRFGKRLWQRYGYERVLRDDEQTLVVARYILNNPVRKRLVERPQDYPFSRSEQYSIDAILSAVQMMGSG
jgi:putative transposase